MTDRELADLAIAAKAGAYAPYSEFKVGAALETKSGKVYTGVNIENSSFGATNCAERTAVFKAVSEGERNITAIAIAGDSSQYIFPCGICRQVFSEFADKDMKIICVDGIGDFVVYKLSDMLPFAFTEIRRK